MILAKLRQGELPADVTIETAAPNEEATNTEDNSTSVNMLCSYTCQISETQNLQVQVQLNPQTGSYSILRWQAVPSGTWQAENTLELWDGATF